MRNSAIEIIYSKYIYMYMMYIQVEGGGGVGSEYKHNLLELSPTCIGFRFEQMHQTLSPAMIIQYNMH